MSDGYGHSAKRIGKFMGTIAKIQYFVYMLICTVSLISYSYKYFLIASGETETAMRFIFLAKIVFIFR